MTSDDRSRGSVHGFLARVRRRLRAAWALHLLAVIGPTAAGLTAALVLLGRWRPWAWPEPAGAIAASLAVLTWVALTIGWRITNDHAARAADRSLTTGDVLAASLELHDDPSPLAERVHARAGNVIAGVSSRAAVPLRMRPRPVALTAVLVVAASVLALAANPQDEVRRRRAAEHAALADEATLLEEAAEALDGEEVAGADELTTELRRLAEELADAGSLEAGRRAIDDAAAALAGKLDPDFLAAKAAARGLEQNLAGEPISGEGRDAAGQLAAAADALAGMSPGELAALAERLSGLAETQAAGNPQLGAALEAAAAALRAGDVGDAAAALSDAASLQAEAADGVARQETVAAGLGAIAASGDRLDQAERSLDAGEEPGGGGEGAGQGEGQGDGEGSGDGQGDGDGSGDGDGDGSGDGQGDGDGSGSGEGEGQADGTASGMVGGASSPTGSGQGGAGSVAGSGFNPSVGIQEGAAVFDPGATDGETLRADPLGRGTPEGEIVGREQGATSRGTALVPLRRVLPRYASDAARAIDQLAIAPSLRSLVRAYFAGLADATR